MKRTPPKTKKARPKTTAKTTVAKIAQPHGGALNAGGTPGNVGGTGRPPSALREVMRMKLAERFPVVEAIADGEMVEQAQVPLLAVLRHAHCPNCNEKLKANDAMEALSVTIAGKVSPKAKDRISAVDMFAKYGLGTTKEISVDDVKGRMASSLDAIRALPYPIESPDVVIAAMRPFWTVTK